MPKLCKRKLAQFLACGVALAFYVMVVSKLDVNSTVIVFPDVLDSAKNRMSVRPDQNISLPLNETASYLYRAYLKRRKSISKASKKFREAYDGGINLNDAGMGDLDEKYAELPTFCQNRGFGEKPKTKYQESTIIISLIDVTAEESLLLLSKILRRTSEDLINDVIVTADVDMKADDKDVLEQALDVCSICRLFFMAGTIYHHRNAVTRFARSTILIFVDARIEPFSEYWLEPLIFEITFNPFSVVSPDLRLRQRNTDTVSEGFSRFGMTWDMEALRVPVTPEQNRLLREEKTFSINQTSIQKEVFAIRKDYFLDLGLFDVMDISKGTGGEHISFSLKVLNCGGEILTTFCSRVYLDIPEIGQKQFLNYPRDYDSLSFSVNQRNITNYYDTYGIVWLDAYSTNLFSVSVHRQHPPAEEEVKGESVQVTTPGNFRRVSPMYQKRPESLPRLLKSKLKSMECETTNYRYVLTRYQEDMVTIDRKTVKHGYIRTLDGMYGVGIESYSLLPVEVLKNIESSIAKRSISLTNAAHREWPSLVLTRNSSHWVGPFSYQQGNIQYNRMWCIAVVVDTGTRINSDRRKEKEENYRLVLQPCKISTVSQVFLFKDNIMRWAGNGAKLCVSAAAIGQRDRTADATISRGLVLTKCTDTERKLKKGSGFDFDLLKIDTEFLEDKS